MGGSLEPDSPDRDIGASLVQRTDFGRAGNESIEDRVVRLVGADKRVLELGCGAGTLTRRLSDAGCSVVAVEHDRELAAEAVAVCERVIVADLDDPEFTRELDANHPFDVIVALDVLQYVEDPVSLACRVKPFLRPEGALIVSVMNVAHGTIRLALLNGSFPYVPAGPLNADQKRFFTRDSVEELLVQSGYLVGHLERHVVPISVPDHGGEAQSWHSDVARRLDRDIDARTAELVLVAYVLPPGQLDLLLRRAREMLDKYEHAERKAENLGRQLVEQTRDMDALRAMADSAAARESQLSRHLMEMHGELVQREQVIEELGGTASLGHGDARNLLEEQRAWAERSAAAVVERDAVIRQLQDALDRQTAWAQSLAAEVAHRDAIIRQLQRSLRFVGRVVVQITLAGRVLPAKLSSMFSTTGARE